MAPEWEFLPANERVWVTLFIAPLFTAHQPCARHWARSPSSLHSSEENRKEAIRLSSSAIRALGKAEGPSNPDFGVQAGFHSKFFFFLIKKILRSESSIRVNKGGRGSAQAEGTECAKVQRPKSIFLWTEALESTQCRRLGSDFVTQKLIKSQKKIKNYMWAF